MHSLPKHRKTRVCSLFGLHNDSLRIGSFRSRNYSSTLLNIRSSTILRLAGVAAIALVIGLALGSTVFPVTKTTTQVSTLQISQQPATVYYDVSTVTMPAGLIVSDNLIQSFVVGNYAFNVTGYSPLPAITTNGVTKVFSAGLLLIFNVTTAYSASAPYELANFTWPGTFSENNPNPSNATLFGGDVRLSWLVSDQLLYLVIAT